MVTLNISARLSLALRVGALDSWLANASMMPSLFADGRRRHATSMRPTSRSVEQRRHISAGILKMKGL